VRVMARPAPGCRWRRSSGRCSAPICRSAFGWRAAFVALTALSLCITAAVVLRLPETNRHKNPRATEWAGLRENFRLVLGSRAFWAYALPGALSYGSIFAFISGSSLVLIRVLGVPTAYFGYCFAFAVSGYMLGTLVARRLLPRIGVDGALRSAHRCRWRPARCSCRRPGWAWCTGGSWWRRCS
jgi:DHA1 family bicyclomycin/chloramphenicol resistance-like MFS transporter